MLTSYLASTAIGDETAEFIMKSVTKMQYIKLLDISIIMMCRLQQYKGAKADIVD